MLGQIILQIVLIALNAAFACAEIAVISVNDAKLDKLAASGNKKAVKLKKLTSQPARFLATIQVAITLSGFIGAAFAADNFSERLTAVIMKAGIGFPEGVLRTVSVIAITLLLAYITLVFSELVPKRLAMKYSEKLALGMAGLIRFTQVLFAPLVWILNISTNVVLRLFGVDPNKEEDTVTEEEILMMSDAGAEKGTIDEDENRIIKNVFAFDDTTAEQVCTHRTDVSVLWSSDPVETWEETIHRTRHSVFPICGESVDNVIGILNAKDYFRLDNKSRDNIMAHAVHEPYFVHEGMKADALFAQMKKKGADHFAVVVDEYGGMTGIVTVTDLVEQLVSEFDDDETGESEAEFEQIADDQWLIPGIMPLSEVCEELGITLPADKFDTFGGYVIAGLGEIPKDGSKTYLECDGLRIDVLEIHHHRVELCRVKKLHTEVRDEDEE
ncbi:putative hemolysin [Ruminococcus sp. YRD2003]|uniref:hemolysin family protein n=1 Tax=Ruminococcus sp. YRD2003 TaxID=1452313 RepID=UPI0008CA314D|nr:putative hemolysin [Ruminococcus flavefaciens]